MRLYVYSKKAKSIVPVNILWLENNQLSFTFNGKIFSRELTGSRLFLVDEQKDVFEITQRLRLFKNPQVFITTLQKENYDITKINFVKFVYHYDDERYGPSIKSFSEADLKIKLSKAIPPYLISDFLTTDTLLPTDEFNLKEVLV